jgi:hypothetical protein
MGVALLVNRIEYAFGNSVVRAAAMGNSAIERKHAETTPVASNPTADRLCCTQAKLCTLNFKL